MIQDLKPYPAYKDSGVEWLGKVPEHWDLIPLKRVARRIQTGSTPPSDNPAYYADSGLPWYGPVCLRDPISFEKPVRHLSDIAVLDGKARVIQGPALAVSVIGNVGKSAILYGKGSTNQQIACFELMTQHALPEFICRQFRLAESSLVASASSATIAILDTARLATSRVALPSASEQHAIVRFLDHFDRRIRRYIRAKQKLISLLNEQKQVIIHRAVTRGLDPNVRLKPSGVEWLGDVPEHWEVKRLKRSCRVQGGYAFPSAAFGDTGVPVVRMNNLRRGVLHLDGAVRIPESECIRAFELRADDILYGLSGSIGVTGSLGNYAVVVNSDLPAQLNQRVARFVPRYEQTAPVYLILVIQTSTFYEQVLAGTTGTAQFNVSAGDIENVIVALPPTYEQERIASQIASTTAPLMIAVDRAAREISLLREHRTRLIADVVTGKLDVREAAAQLPEEPAELDESDATEEVEESEPLDDIETLPESDEESEGTTPTPVP